MMSAARSPRGISGGAHVDTIYPSTPQSPDILLIGGREHVLYHGLFDPLKIVDAKLLWLNSALVWSIALYTVLLAVTLGDTGWWALLAVLAAAFPVIAVSPFIESRSGVTTPVAIDEKDRSGTWSRMIISTRRHAPLTVTAHADMADYLLDALTDDEPSHTSAITRCCDDQLNPPSTRWHEWNSIAAPIAAIVAIAVIYLVR